MIRPDVIVIGSGFGGAVLSCRLSERGYRILVLECGRHWSPEDYPREPDNAWIWDEDEPESQNGWIDLRFLDGMWVMQGAGVGGASLIYANASIDVKPTAFESGWSSEITYSASPEERLPRPARGSRETTDRRPMP